MNNELLGTQIAKYRKAAGITQEELGKAVGVSTQAVSRWECGGAPDVSLLPAIADRLGVTIDTLFGRSEEGVRDIYESLYLWLSAIPQKERMKELYYLLSMTPDLLNDAFKDYPFDPALVRQHVLSNAYTTGHHLLREVFDLDEGLFLTVRGEDCPFYLLMPEPSEGYEPNLFSAGEYRTLFELLGRPGVLDILFFLHRDLYLRSYTARALADRLGKDPEETAALLDAMAKGKLLDTQAIETERGIERIYCREENHGLIPFLFLARWLIDPSNSWRNVWHNRKHPILRPKE